MNRLAVSSALTFLIIFGGIVALTGALTALSPRSGTFTSPPRVLAPDATFSYNSSTWLNLTLAVSGRSLDVGEYISINASLFNTRYGDDYLKSPSQWNMIAGPAPCGQLPLGVGILRGSWSLANLSEATPLQVYYPGFYDCPVMFSIDHYTFAPRSDVVTEFSPQPSGMVSVGTQNATMGLDAWGYWTVARQANGSLTYYPGRFGSLEPGVYTAVADDPWGQVALLTFTVKSSSALPTCSSIATNSSYVPHAVQPTSGNPLALTAYYLDPHDNDSIFLALDNINGSSVTVVSLGGLGNSYSPFQVNLFPGETSVGDWYGIVSGGVSYPSVVPAQGCLLLHLELPGPAISYLGITIQFLGGRSETLLKGGLPLVV